MVILCKDSISAFDTNTGYRIFVDPRKNMVCLAPIDDAPPVELGVYDNWRDAYFALEELIDSLKTTVITSRCRRTAATHS